jgi:hypothetical protein
MFDVMRFDLLLFMHALLALTARSLYLMSDQAQARTVRSRNIRY